MACFLVTAAEAVVVTTVARAVEASEVKKTGKVEVPGAISLDTVENGTEIPWSRKLKCLSYFLWGGALLLCFEHIWHGEVVPFFPFLTAMSDPGDTAEMLHEMSTVGVTMAALVTAAWGVMVCAVDTMIRRVTGMAKMTV